LNLAISYRQGANSLGAEPINHLDSQKGEALPLPI
jgi:hypothetical protein